MDSEAADVVRRVYSMSLDGYGVQQIAAALSAEKILNPTHYWQSKGMGRGGLKANRGDAFWNNSTIYKMLTLQEYCGDVINFKILQCQGLSAEVTRPAR